MDLTRLRRLAILFAGYFAAAYGGALLYRLGHTSPALIWPAGGIGLAGLVIGGIGLWPALFAAAACSYLLLGHGIGFALVLGAASAGQALVGVRLLRMFDFDPSLSRLRDALAIGIASFIATLVTPLVGVAYLAFTGASITGLLGPWWVGGILSTIVVGTFLMRWLPRVRFTRTTNEYAEVIILLVSLAVIDYFVFCTSHSSLRGIPLVYLVLFPLMWIALRLGPRMMTVALLFTTVVALAGTAARTTPARLGTSLFLIEIFMIIVSYLFITMVAVSEERKDATNALRRQVGTLETALTQIHSEDEAKNEFIAVLAHELRNPLAPLVSSLELMRLTEPETGSRREAVEGMYGRARVMGRLLDDLLDISRISRHKLELATERIDIGTVATSAVKAVEPEFARRRQEFYFHSPRESIGLVADPLRLEQIIINLLNNAAKYTQNGGKISLTIEQERAEAVIRVKDNGAGIEPQMLVRIFDAFRQGEPGRRATSGLGIGLALSKNLAELHGGRIDAVSAGPGRGSEFTVRLPLTEHGAEPAPLAGRENQQLPLIKKNGRPLSILVVDDNGAAAESMAELLRHLGNEVRTALDGKSALKAFDESPARVIILDIGLPDLDGHEIARRLRKRDAKSVLIALSGYGQREDKERAREAGFDYHLTKPAGLSDIQDILNQIGD